MSYVPPLKIDEAAEAARPLLEATEKKFGQVLNLFGTLAYQPNVLQGVATIQEGIENDLPARFRELAYVEASAINQCTYCSHYHRKAAFKVGVPRQQISAIDGRHDGESFTPEEQVVLEYTRQLTKTAHVDEAIVCKLKEFLTDQQLVTLAATVALANFTNRINNGLGIELP